MMQRAKRPAPADDALLDQFEEGDDGMLPEFPTQPFRYIPPKGSPPIPPRASRPRVSQAMHDDDYDQQPPLCQRVRKTEDPNQAPPAPRRRGLLRRVLSWSIRGSAPHLVQIGVGMLAMLALIVLWSTTVSGWQSLQVQWHDGDSRITQADYNVGHDGISHFVTLYLDGQTIVMEFPHNGDATQMRLYAHRYYPHDPVHRLVSLTRTSISTHDVLLVSTEGFALPFVLYNGSDGMYHVNP